MLPVIKDYEKKFVGIDIEQAENVLQRSQWTLY